MGLIHHLLMCAVHLLFVVIDILMTMVLIKVIYQKWQPEWLSQINNAVEPVMISITGHLGAWVTRITDRTYTDKTLTLIFIFSLLAVRFIICGLV